MATQLKKIGGGIPLGFFFFLPYSCTAQSHLALSHRTGWHECCYAENRVCPLQAASYWLLSNWDAWQLWSCNLEHSSLRLRDSHRSTVICLLNTAPDWQWAVENYVVFNDAEKSKMIKSGYNENCSARLPNFPFN